MRIFFLFQDTSPHPFLQVLPGQSDESRLTLPLSDATTATPRDYGDDEPPFHIVFNALWTKILHKPGC